MVLVTPNEGSAMRDAIVRARTHTREAYLTEENARLVCEIERLEKELSALVDHRTITCDDLPPQLSVPVRKDAQAGWCNVRHNPDLIRVRAFCFTEGETYAVANYVSKALLGVAQDPFAVMLALHKEVTHSVARCASGLGTHVRELNRPA